MRCFGGNCLFLSTNGENIVDLKWPGPWIIMGIFGREFALVYFGRHAIEVHLNGFRYKNKILTL